ncbi:Uncharacterised protein [Mycobacteroides abscessus subsp. massiliense]|nr:Uncharacterised protein [Mycobacteroides abscessus subsp. massiliense]
MAGSFRFTVQSSLVDGGGLGLDVGPAVPGDDGVGDVEAMVLVGVLDTVLSPPVHAQARASAAGSTVSAATTSILRTAPHTTDIYRRCHGGGS